MLTTAQIGQVPDSPEHYYRPLASDPKVTLDLSVGTVPYIGDVIEGLQHGIMPAPHNAGLVSQVPYEDEQDIVDEPDLVTFDLVALSLGRSRAYLMPTDRQGVAKNSGAVQVEGVVAMTRLDSGLVTITHITEEPTTGWEKRKVPYIPRNPGKRTMRALGCDAIQLEITESMPTAGIAHLKRRVPAYFFSHNVRTRTV